jgi:drug/metabolite transporter (DMT)-like permease
MQATVRSGDVMTIAYIIILMAALLYAAGALLVKRATEFGIGAWRTAFVANMTAVLVNLPLLALGGTWRADLWWQPVIVAVCYVGGQLLTFLSLDRGDVSVATPVLGIKILLVAVLVALFGGEALRWQLWVAALLAVAGIALLNRRVVTGRHHDVGRTIITAGSAAACYALLDVLVQQWAPLWGLGRFVPLVVGIAAVLSVGFIPLFRAPLSAVPRPAWGWLIAGALILGIQSLLFVSLVATKGHAASINVVYSSRGLWSVILVWWLGHWVQSREQHLGERAARRGRDDDCGDRAGVDVRGRAMSSPRRGLLDSQPW